MPLQCLEESWLHSLKRMCCVPGCAGDACMAPTQGLLTCSISFASSNSFLASPPTVSSLKILG